MPHLIGGQLNVSFRDFHAGLVHQTIEEVVRLDAESPASRYLHEWPIAILAGVVPEFASRGVGQRDHLVGIVDRMSGLFLVSQRRQGLLQQFLQI